MNDNHKFSESDTEVKSFNDLPINIKNMSDYPTKEGI